MQVHPQQISPAENFDIFYYLRNPNDSTTYYVRAVVYDIRTGAVLKTVNLTQATTNAHLFSATTQAPADSTGNGRNIVAVASVYTDSGYTTKSTDYEEEESYFLVKAINPFVGGGGGVDYRTVREILQEELQKLPKPEPVSLDGLFGAIGALQREINRVPKELPDMPDAPEPVDLKPVLDAIDALKTQIAALPEPAEPDFEPLMKAINTLRPAIEKMSASLGSTLSGEIEGRLQDLGDQLLKEIQDAIAKDLGGREITFPMDSIMPKKQPPQPSIDSVRHLMGV